MGSDGDCQLSSRSTPTTRGPLHRAGLLVCGAALCVAMLFSPVKLCFMALVLHVPCPGCGMTRATLSLLRGDIAQAFALHPLAPLLVPFAGALVATQTANYLHTGASFGATRFPRWIELTAAAFAVLLLVVWSARFLGYFGGPVSLY